MASAMRKMAVYLGLVEDDHRYDDQYQDEYGAEEYEEYDAEFIDQGDPRDVMPHDDGGGMDQSGVPEQGDHLAEHENRLPGLGRLPEQRAGHLPQTGGIRAVADHEAAYRLVGVELKIGAAGAGRRHVNTGTGQAFLEGPAVIRRGDHDRRTVTVRNGGEKILAHPAAEFLLVPVEQDDVPAAPSLGDLDPGRHGVSVQARANAGLIVRAGQPG